MSSDYNISSITINGRFAGGVIDITAEGKWHTLEKFIAYMGNEKRGMSIKRDLAKGQRDFLERYKRLLGLGMASQGAAVGISFKGRSATVGIDSGNYLRALHNLRVEQKGYLATLKFAPGALNSVGAGKKRLAVYAAIFEEGSHRQAPNPLWRAAFKKSGGEAGLIKVVRGAVQKRLGKMGVHVGHSGYEIN